jgi:hypothetical protein
MFHVPPNPREQMGQKSRVYLQMIGAQLENTIGVMRIACLHLKLGGVGITVKGPLSALVWPAFPDCQD